MRAAQGRAAAADAGPGRPAAATTRGTRRLSVLLLLAALSSSTFMMAHAFLLPAASYASSRATTAAAARGAARWAAKPTGPDHSQEAVIKHPKDAAGAGAKAKKKQAGPGPQQQDEMAMLSQALGEQDLLQQLLETMGRDSLSETTLDSVLRVYCTHVQPSFAAPWQRLQQIASTSSGFVIEGRRIITNAHSVEVRLYALWRIGDCAPMSRPTD